MTVLTKLSEDLAAAAERQARLPTTRRRSRRVAAAVVTCTVGAGGVALASGVWSPPVGDEQRGHPTISPSSPPPDQLELLGVLRRGATAADHGVQSRYALRFQDPSLHGVRTGFVRLLGTGPNGRGFVLIPVQEASGKADALCLFEQDTDGGGQSCYSTADVRHGIAVIGSSPAPVPEPPAGAEPKTDSHGSHFMRNRADSLVGGRLSGLVPDGVRAVRIGGAEPAPVHDNFFSTALTASAAANGLGEITWLDADGRPVPRG